MASGTFIIQSITSSKSVLTLTNDKVDFVAVVKNDTGINFSVGGYDIRVRNSGRLLKNDDTLGQWNTGVTKTISFSVSSSEILSNPNVYSVVSQHLLTNRAFTNWTFEPYGLNGGAGTGGTAQMPTPIVNAYAPTIDTITMTRAMSDGTENDEGEKLKTSLAVSLAAQTFVNNFALNVYYKQNGTPTTTDYTGVKTFDSTTPTPYSISEIVNDGVTDAIDFITRTGDFGNGSNWGFLFVFGDQYESTTASYSIPRAFANVHLSGKSTGGVAFGKFSRSEEGKPLFECRYPIEGVNLYELTETASGSKYFTSDIDTGGRMYVGNDVYAVRKFTLLDTNTHAATKVTTVSTNVITPITQSDILLSITGSVRRASNGTGYPWGSVWAAGSDITSIFVGGASDIQYRITWTIGTAFTVIEYARKL